LKNQKGIHKQNQLKCNDQGTLHKLEMLTLGELLHTVRCTSDEGKSTPPSTATSLGLDGVALRPCNKKMHLRIHTEQEQLGSDKFNRDGCVN
jgi:hypothetical protein